MCLNQHGRLLLLRWRDPHDGTIKWEPPGGGIEPGEAPFEAACRELTEETGLPATMILPRAVQIERTFRWNGRDHEHTEWFFLARIPASDAQSPGDELRGQAFRADESDHYLGHRWFTPAEIRLLTDTVEPPQFLEIVATLTS